MNSQHPKASQYEFSVRQSFSATLTEEADYNGDNSPSVFCEKDPYLEAKLDQIFGIALRPN
jgi:hypothetical protein